MEPVQMPVNLSDLKNSNLENVLESLSHAAVSFGMKLLAAVIILSVGLWLAKKFTKHVRRVMEFRKLEPSLQTFLG